ncbi:MAG: hypothetical protein GWN99_07745 [Gemmatimonadetes bacterium]|uniref:Uncharacterized protein n=1 Tax=Candidatus Kutchimonas denitrificans TaxID=3056748 RepID=A0AAE5C952_9BACT|nr:hypothetical protein [Gemmatimonadota bacterium]NIR75121.1 hypothetical protein [Candidatus Kutchimonas denitrificans]NIS00953.1 hypothetical protein [Gemmatimonadota bacterium]NIT66570.1 hypothetical protein [Gemmatimonadota bacterium]NIU52916.1 hypothetical protein [Gemmatimonadota bacterium]
MSDPLDEFRKQRKKWPYPDWLAEGGLPEEQLLAAIQEATRPSEAEPKPGAPGEGQVVPAVPRRRYIYRSTEMVRVSPNVFRCKVTVYSAAGEFEGEAEGPEFPGARAEIAARATLDALNNAEGGSVMLGLKGARVLRIFESPIVVVGVYGLNTKATPLVGACLVDNSVEQSATLATLQAADRWLAWEAKKRSK